MKEKIVLVIDAYLLALAGAISANYLITGDKDLLSLGMFRGTLIVSFKDFLKNNLRN